MNLIRTANPAPPAMRDFAMFRVILHRDGKHDKGFVADCLRLALPFSSSDAWRLMVVAQYFGKSLLTTAHLELAELYRDELQANGLTVSLEPA